MKRNLLVFVLLGIFVFMAWSYIDLQGQMWQLENDNKIINDKIDIIVSNIPTLKQSGIYSDLVKSVNSP